MVQFKKMTIWTKLCMGEFFRLCERTLERSLWFKAVVVRCDTQILGFQADIQPTSLDEFRGLLKDVSEFRPWLYRQMLLHYPAIGEVKNSPGWFWFQYPGTVLFVSSDFIEQKRDWQFLFFITAIRYKRLCGLRSWNPPLRLLRIQLKELLRIRKQVEDPEMMMEIGYQLTIRLAELMRCGSRRFLASHSITHLIHNIDRVKTEAFR